MTAHVKPPPGATHRPPSPAREAFRQLGLDSPGELILHLPLRYEDETRLTPITRLEPGRPAQVEGRVTQVEVTPRGRRQLVFLLDDDSGDEPLRVRLLHFHPGQASQLRAGAQVRAFGEVRGGLLGLEMVHPRYRVLARPTPLPAALTPVYPTVAGLAQHRLRQAVKAALDSADLADTVPEAALRRLDLPAFEATLRFLHRPPPGADTALLETRQGPAWRRLKFDELLAQQLSLGRAVRRNETRRAPILRDGDGRAEGLRALLPFALTAAQSRCADEIRRDLGRPHPMHRLLQGDVGSGKTCVAALAAAHAAGSGGQVAIMAPTELLAEQLQQKLAAWFAPLGEPVLWLSSASKGRTRQTTLDALHEGRAHIVVGTHALIQDAVSFKNLALVIVDEQHRFGVEQRLALREKGHPALTPHLLMMTATPIPRSLAMSYFADLNVSSLDELPPGRRPIDTRIMADTRRDEVIERLRDYCAEGGQVYWVCPLIEESAKIDLKAALDAHAEIAAALPDLRVGLAHGRMRAAEKAAAMAAFKAGETAILVATTVIEVGVDVPNATLMVIEHAERMGLAQLHQLRGRVGRSDRVSSCLLLYGGPLGEVARQRLNIIRDSQDGFEIARQDLRLRGPGEFLGARQSGAALMRFADPETDADLLDAARDLAQTMLDADSPAVDAHLCRWQPRGAALFHA